MSSERRRCEHPSYVLEGQAVRATADAGVVGGRLVAVAVAVVAKQHRKHPVPPHRTRQSPGFLPIRHPSLRQAAIQANNAKPIRGSVPCSSPESRHRSRTWRVCSTEKLVPAYCCSNRGVPALCTRFLLPSPTACNAWHVSRSRFNCPTATLILQRQRRASQGQC